MSNMPSENDPNLDGCFLFILAFGVLIILLAVATLLGAQL